MGEQKSLWPRGGVDYPGTLEEFFAFFPDEGACHRYLEQLRWSEQFPK